MQEIYPENMDILNNMIKSAKQLNQEFTKQKKELSGKNIKIWHDLRHEIKKSHI